MQIQASHTKKAEHAPSPGASFLPTAPVNTASTRASPKGLNGLPEELIEHIFKQLQSQASLAAVSATSREFHRIVEPILYNDVTLVVSSRTEDDTVVPAKHETTRAFLRTIAARPHLRRYVKTLKIISNGKEDLVLSPTAAHVGKYSDSQALSGALLLVQFMAGEGYKNPGVLHAVCTASNLRNMHLDFIHILQAASQTVYDVSQPDTSINEIWDRIILQEAPFPPSVERLTIHLDALDAPKGRPALVCALSALLHNLHTAAPQLRHVELVLQTPLGLLSPFGFMDIGVLTYELVVSCREAGVVIEERTVLKPNNHGWLSPRLMQQYIYQS